MKRSLIGRICLLIAPLLAPGLSACGMVQPVAPWEKGALARPAMRFDGNRLESAYSAHTYDSKEAAFGSGSVGGGGCGCN